MIEIKERSLEEKVDYLIQNFALQHTKIESLDIRAKRIEQAFILLGELITSLLDPLLPILKLLKEWSA